MPKKGHTEEQIVAALQQAESGEKVEEVCRRMGISQATYYSWKKQYAGLGIAELRELRQLREENTRLKRLVADLSLDRQILQEIVSKNVWSAARLQGKSGEDEVVRENVFGLCGVELLATMRNPHVPVLNKVVRSEGPLF
jgi:putative transposase